MKSAFIGAAIGLGLAGGYVHQENQITSNPKTDIVVDSLFETKQGNDLSVTNLFKVASCNPGVLHSCVMGVTQDDGSTKFYVTGGTPSELIRASDDVVKGGRYLAFEDGNRLIGMRQVRR